MSLEVILSAVVGLLFGSLLFSVPAFFLVLLGGFLRKKLAKAYSLSWIISSLIVVFFFSFLLIVFVYFFPIVSSIPEQTIGELPSVLMPSDSEWFLFWFYISVKILSVSLIVSVLLIPFVLLGSFLLDLVKANKKLVTIPMPAKSFLAIYFSLIIFFGLLLHVFYWIPFGLIYLLYFG